MKKIYSFLLFAVGLLLAAPASHAQLGFDLRILTGEAAQYAGNLTPAGFQHVRVTWTSNRRVPRLPQVNGAWYSASFTFRVPKTLTPTPVSTYNGGAFTPSTQITNFRAGTGTLGPLAGWADFGLRDQYSGGNDIVTWEGTDVGGVNDGFVYFTIVHSFTNSNRNYNPGQAYDLLEFDVPAGWDCMGCMQLVTPLTGSATILSLGSSLEPYADFSELPTVTSTFPFPFNQVNVAQNNQPLPLDLISFDATKTNDGRVQLDWSTASEINTAYFDVQRSANGIDFTETVAHMAAAGNSSVKLNYLTYDRTPMNGVNYYRLKMVDRDGKFEYSDTRTVNFTAGTSNNVVVAPNPFSTATELRITADQDQAVDYIITDAAGKRVKAGTIQVTKGMTTKQSLDLNDMAAGVYFLNAVGKSVNGQVKITKQQ